MQTFIALVMMVMVGVMLVSIIAPMFKFSVCPSCRDLRGGNVPNYTRGGGMCEGCINYLRSRL